QTFAAYCFRKIGKIIRCERIMNSHWNITAFEDDDLGTTPGNESRRMADVCYYTDGKGHWLRREWKPQCRAEVFIYGGCQGVKGHRGVHWCYSTSGSFEWQDNANDPQHDGCAGST